MWYLRYPHRQIDRQTDRQTYLLLTILCNRSCGKSNYWKVSSINDVTRFDSPSPICHISSQISEPPSKMTSHAREPPSPGKVMTIIVRTSGSQYRSTVYRCNASVPQPALQSSCSRLPSSHPSNDHHRQHTPATGQRMTFCESQRVLHDVTTLNPPPPPVRHVSSH